MLPASHGLLLCPLLHPGRGGNQATLPSSNESIIQSLINSFWDGKDPTPSSMSWLSPPSDSSPTPASCTCTYPEQKQRFLLPPHSPAPTDHPTVSFLLSTEGVKKVSKHTQPQKDSQGKYPCLHDSSFSNSMLISKSVGPSLKSYLIHLHARLKCVRVSDSCNLQKSPCPYKVELIVSFPVQLYVTLILNHALYQLASKGHFQKREHNNRVTTSHFLLIKKGKNGFPRP